MPVKDYSQAKIYKIFCVDNECFYIGSTTNKSLAKRRQYHIDCANAYPNRKVYKHIRENGGWDLWNIVMIKKVEGITNDEELRMAEEEERVKHHGQLYLLNSQRAYCSPEVAVERNRENKKQYHKANKERLAEKGKQYRQEHEEECNERSRQYNEKNRDWINERQKNYYQNNKEFINTQAKQKLLCSICNCWVRKSDFARHERSQKHQLNLQEVKTV